MQIANEFQMVIDADLLDETLKSVLYSVEVLQGLTSQSQDRLSISTEFTIIKEVLGDLQRMVAEDKKKKQRANAEENLFQASELLANAWTQYRHNPVHREYQSDYADAQCAYEAAFNNALVYDISEERIKELISVEYSASRLDGVHNTSRFD